MGVGETFEKYTFWFVSSNSLGKEISKILVDRALKYDEYFSGKKVSVLGVVYVSANWYVTVFPNSRYGELLILSSCANVYVILESLVDVVNFEGKALANGEIFSSTVIPNPYIYSVVVPVDVSVSSKVTSEGSAGACRVI